MRIRIITTEPFPNGGAPTNRIHSYGKGFIENNIKVSVHCIKPTELPNHVFNKVYKGISDGIEFEYASKKTVINNNILIKIIDNLRGILNISLSILKEKNNKTNAVIYYSESSARALILWIICKSKNILFLKEESEYPIVYKKNKINSYIFIHFHYKLFDGLLLMTNNLMQYFKPIKNKSAKTLHVPMTVDTNRFLDKKKSIPHEKYIAYCGLLNNKKDGVDLLIDAFNLIQKEFLGIKLYLIGDAASLEESNLYQKKIKENLICEKVLITGRVDKDNIPELLCNAMILVLPRPESLQASGGFPTKLGEYLATGNPVIATRVGEIPNYLQDGSNAFLAEPGNIASLVSKMKFILNNYSLALEIGNKGRETALKHFNYNTQAKKISNFIYNLNK